MKGHTSHQLDVTRLHPPPLAISLIRIREPSCLPDIYRRLHDDDNTFFVPHDLEVSLAEVSFGAHQLFLFPHLHSHFPHIRPACPPKLRNEGVKWKGEGGGGGASCSGRP